MMTESDTSTRDSATWDDSTGYLFQMVIQSMSEIVFVKDLHGHYLTCNQAFEDFFGVRKQQLVGKRTSDLFQESAEEFAFQDEQVARTGKKLTVTKIHQVGTDQVLLETNLTPVYDTNKQIVGIMGVGRDITKRQQEWTWATRSERMDAITGLTSELAHEFNNTFMAVKSTLWEQLQRSALPQDTVSDIEKCLQALVKSAELTKKLIGYAQRSPTAFAITHFNHLVQKVLIAERPKLSDQLVIRSDFSKSLWEISGSENSLMNVVTQLLHNSVEAMPKGGVIQISTENVVLRAQDVAQTPNRRTGMYIRFRITDQGSGIAEEIQPRLFEPFVTTKTPGSGAGLGLAMVYGIVQQHNGWVEFQTKPGAGTTFDLYLPKTYVPTQLEEQKQPPVSRKSTSNLRILLVEDDDIIRNLAKTILQRAGHHVEMAVNGAEAVEFYRMNHTEIDLVVLDMTMPIMGGAEAVRNMRRINPKVQVLITTGYSFEEIDEESEGNIIGYMHKPYTPPDLVERIKEYYHV
ncbi:MAG: ATP-binding protein [Zavarzinella sp.]